MIYISSLILRWPTLHNVITLYVSVYNQTHLLMVLANDFLMVSDLPLYDLLFSCWNFDCCLLILFVCAFNSYIIFLSFLPIILYSKMLFLFFLIVHFTLVTNHICHQYQLTCNSQTWYFPLIEKLLTFPSCLLLNKHKFHLPLTFFQFHYSSFLILTLTVFSQHSVSLHSVYEYLLICHEHQ